MAGLLPPCARCGSRDVEPTRVPMTGQVLELCADCGEARPLVPDPPRVRARPEAPRLRTTCGRCGASRNRHRSGDGLCGECRDRDAKRAKRTRAA